MSEFENKKALPNPINPSSIGTDALVSKVKTASPSGNDQHDWDENPDGSDCSTQREEDMRTSFGFTDNFAEGTEFSGRFSIETKQDSHSKPAEDFKPLSGSITKTVETQENI